MTETDLPSELPPLIPENHESSSSKNKTDKITSSDSKSKSSKKPTTETEKSAEDKHAKSSEKSSNSSSKNKSNSKPAASSTTTTDTTSLTKKEDLFSRFELLQYPVLDSKISCQQLRQLSNLVKLKNCSTASYFSHSSAWETLEPVYHEPRQPKTDPTSRHRPMPAAFDEIWCPVLADGEDSDMIIPPTFTYLENGAVKQTLPTLMTNPIRKDALPGYYQH